MRFQGCLQKSYAHTGRYYGGRSDQYAWNSQSFLHAWKNIFKSRLRLSIYERLKIVNTTHPLYWD